MLALGAKLASHISVPALVFLHGELGAGKSTLVRGFMAGLGYQGRVKSPTYTLVEPYEVGEDIIYHMDLYRLADPEELEFLGIRDILSGRSICLIEWPEKAEGLLGKADIDINISYLENGRSIVIESEKGTKLTFFNEL